MTWKWVFDYAGTRPNDLPGCNSIRRKPAWAEPEVYFRTVHVTLDDAGPPAAYREQPVEIAPGPMGAFENGNVSTLTRRVPADRVVSAVFLARRTLRPSTPAGMPVVPSA